MLVTWIGFATGKSSYAFNMMTLFVCLIITLLDRVGNLDWSLKMEWSGKKGFNEAKDEKWYSDLTGKHAGNVRTHGNLTFLRIFDAGHMVKSKLS